MAKARLLYRPATNSVRNKAAKASWTSQRTTATSSQSCKSELDIAEEDLERSRLEKSTATEHTEPNGFLYLDLHERLDTAKLDMLPEAACRHVFNDATEHIRIGPCIFHWSQASKLKLWVLCNLHHEIQDRIRIPFSLEQLLVSACQDDEIMMQKKSWSGCIEAIARCVAAFQHATDATEHSHCDAIVAKLYSYATALAQKTSPYLRQHLLALLYEYIKNRTYDSAMKHLLNKSLKETGDGVWFWVGAGPQRRECLNLLEICIKAVIETGEALREEMASYRVS